MADPLAVAEPPVGFWAAQVALTRSAKAFRAAICFSVGGFRLPLGAGEGSLSGISSYIIQRPAFIEAFIEPSLSLH